MSAELGRGNIAGRIAQILALVASRRQGVTVAELEEALGVGRRTVMRYLASLAACDLVDPPGRCGGIGYYRAGQRFRDLAKAAAS